MKQLSEPMHLLKCFVSKSNPIDKESRTHCKQPIGTLVKMQKILILFLIKKIPKFWKRIENLKFTWKYFGKTPKILDFSPRQFYK